MFIREKEVALLRPVKNLKTVREKVQATALLSHITENHCGFLKGFGFLNKLRLFGNFLGGKPNHCPVILFQGSSNRVASGKQTSKRSMSTRDRIEWPILFLLPYRFAFLC
jgi:hypothetical protein